MALVGEWGVLENGNKLHHHMEWSKSNRPFSFCWHYKMRLPPPLSHDLIFAVSSVLLALHHKMTLPAHCFTTKTWSDKHAFIPWNQRRLRWLWWHRLWLFRHCVDRKRLFDVATDRSRPRGISELAILCSQRCNDTSRLPSPSVVSVLTQFTSICLAWRLNLPLDISKTK